MFWKIRILTIALLLGLFVSQDASPAALSSKTKPHPPVQISIEPLQSGLLSSNIKPGDVVEFRVTITSMVDTPEMQIQVKLDDGAELISGELSWTGPAMKNEMKILPITIKAPQKGIGLVKAQLSITLSSGIVFTTSSEYELGGTKKPKPESARPVKKDSKGHNVIEYR